MHSVKTRTSFLFKKYYNKTASIKEREELFQIIKTTSDDKLKELMREEWDNLEMTDPLFNSDQSMEMLNKIFPAEQQSNEQQEEFVPITDVSWSSRFKRISVAAAILVLLSSGMYFYFKPSLSPQAQIAYTPIFQDIPPGGNKATLTLSDGQTIILDSAKNGIIASTKSFKIVKTESGQVVYQPFERIQNNALGAEFNTITTPRGGEYRVVLPDGSKVWLNSASSIKFPGVFKGNTRSVEIEGEAYFEITKNSAMPFKVKSKNVDIEVIGTHFNVKTYTGDEVMKTTLLEGSIKIEGGNSSHLLKPGQQAVLIGNEMKVLSDVDIEEQIAWKNGLFQFKDAGIQDVMHQAALWYDLNVSFEGKIPEKYFTGKVSRNVNASEFMNMLMYTGVKFKIEGKNIVVINK
jgi:ferric-dicitrate binding protein FerR (iron transport regulator)